MRASASVTLAAFNWSASSSMWERISSAKSVVDRFLRRQNIALSLLLFGTENQADGPRQPPPLAGLLQKLGTPLGSQGVKPRLAIVLGDAPPGADPALVLEALERQIERAVVHE